MKFMSNFEFKKWISIFLLILAAIVSYVAIMNFDVISDWFRVLFGHLSPFFAGAMIAYLLDIPCSALQRLFMKMKNTFLQKHARGLSVLITYLIVIVFVIVALMIIIPEIGKSAAEFVTGFPVYIERAMYYITDFLENSEIAQYIDSKGLLDLFSLQTLMDNFSLDSAWKSFLNLLNISAYVLSMSSFVFKVVVALISSVYLLLESKEIYAFFLKLTNSFIPQKAFSVLQKYMSYANDYFKRFLYWNTLDGFIVGALSVVGLLVIGPRYAVILGVLEGITNMIPYFGAIIGSVVIILIVLLTDGFSTALIVGIFLLVVQQIDGNIIKPKLYGGSFNMSPFLVILSITVGGAYYGVLGMIIAIPLTAVIKNIIGDILEHRTRKEKE